MTDLLLADDYVLRPLVRADAPAMAAAVRESLPHLGPWMTWAHARYDDTDAVAWIDACAAARADGNAHEFGIFARNGHDYVGAAGLNQFNRVNRFCNLGYWVRASAQRQGAGLAAIRALAAFAFDRLGQARVEIVVADGNLPSLALARKAGALHECVARNRLSLHGRSVAAHVLSLVPDAR